MSGKELLKKDSAALAAFSEAQLKECFAPYLKMIKPEENKGEDGKVRIASGNKRVAKGQSELDKTKALFNRMAGKMGLDTL